MRIAITGVTGFIGFHVAVQALADGHEVTGVFASKTPQKEELRNFLFGRGAKLFEGDLLDTASLSAAMQGADCVCHLAAAFRESGVSDEYFLQRNVQGTMNVMTAASEAGVRRLVLCSTAGIYGQRVAGVIDENFPIRPWNIYEQSKVEAEKLVRTRSEAMGLEYVILRPASVYGPGDERLLKLFKAAAKGRFPLFGNGSGRRHMVYVADVANAFIRASLLPQAASQEFIIAGPEAVPLSKLLEQLAVVVGRRKCGPRLPLYPMQVISAIVEDAAKLLSIAPPLYRRRMDFYLNDAEFSVRRAENVLDWRPLVELRDGLARTYDSYCKQGVIGARSSVMRACVSAIIAFQTLSFSVESIFGLPIAVA